MPNGPRREKTCLWVFANNIVADQPVHPRSLISAFVVRFWAVTLIFISGHGSAISFAKQRKSDSNYNLVKN